MNTAALLAAASVAAVVVTPVARAVSAPAQTQADTHADAGADDWWKDAVFYEIFVRSFADSTEGPLANDGVGDIAGLIGRLDELNDGKPGGDDLGINALWLMPIAQSPSYHGYDVADYYTVDDEYGTNEDFKRLIEECEKRGIRVIVDLVLNHCSSEHPWFQKAADPQSPYHDWFVWRSEKPDWKDNLHMWHDRLKDETGKYYYGFFWHGMPDLNYDNPFVGATAMDISRHWLEDLGAHGFRLDAVRYLFERGENIGAAPETVAWLEDWHEFVKAVDPQAFSVGEIWGPTEEVRRYVPNAMDSAFEFQLAETLVAAVNSGEAGALAEHIDHLNDAYPGNAPYSTFITNHDQDRAMSQFGGPDGEGFARSRLAASLLLTLPGTPFLYYGEEIGMTGTKPDPDIRTPMQWTPEPTRSGFTTAEPWRAVNADVGVVNVEDQKAETGSLWRHYQRLIGLRLNHAPLRRGATAVLETGTPELLAFTRTLDDQTLLVLANMSDRPLREFGVTFDAGEPESLVRASVLEGSARPRAKRAGADGVVRNWQPVNRLGPREVVVVRVMP